MENKSHGVRNGSRTVFCSENRFSLPSFMSSPVPTPVAESLAAGARMRRHSCALYLWGFLFRVCRAFQSLKDCNTCATLHVCVSGPCEWPRARGKSLLQSPKTATDDIDDAIHQPTISNGNPAATLGASDPDSTEAKSGSSYCNETVTFQSVLMTSLRSKRPTNRSKPPMRCRSHRA